ncbi:MAG: FKBP-type peptidyl-prolyl cis-trans isomerase [Microbacteriaceae bacterium]
MRSIARVVAVASSVVVISASLAGCTPASSCEPTLPTGSASLVDAPGALGTKPTVDFPMPLVSRSAAVDVISEGKGARVSEGDYVDFDAVVVRGDDLTELTATSYVSGESERLHVLAGTNVIAEAFLCQRAGSRIALTGTVQEIFGDVTGNALKATDTVAVVFDVVAAYPGKASGTPQLAQDGMPAVTSDPNGRPGIAVPNIDAPTELRISTLTKGDGAVITEGQTVVAHYTGVLWGGSVFDSSWDKDRPANLVALDFTTNDGKGVVPGFAKALIGQTIGSRVLAVIPPSEGYPAGKAPSSIPDGSTMIFVIDILGTR